MSRKRETTTVQDENPFIEVILSRSSYRVGESVVGTIRLVPPSTTTTTATNSKNPRDVFSDSYLFVAGYCRVDPRWHQASEYAKVYESRAVHHKLQNRQHSSSGGVVLIDEHCICFWTSEVILLSELQERTIGRWEDVKPKPIIGKRIGSDESATSNGVNPSARNGHQDPNNDKKSTSNGSLSSYPTKSLNQQQLAFTFRAELPINLPHSVQANSCRYFYTVMVGTRVKLPSTRKQWLRHGTPLRVLSLRPDQPPPQPQQSTRPTIYPIGSCTAMAHSVGLPCHVSATELHQPTGQILVNRRGLRSMTRRNPDAAAQNLQTMRITDLQGIPCCVLTVMGVSTTSPGSRMVLKFDFPRGNNQTTSSTSWTPCYQVSASLEGHEIAIGVDGTQRKRAQAYLFDTAHATVDPDCTERVNLSLLVPLDAPTTVQADVVEVSVKCTIDITVGSSKTLTYSNLRLELPCRIVHSLSEYEVVLSGEDEDQDEDDAYLKLPLDELILGPSYRSSGSDCYLSDDPPLIETAALRVTQEANHPSSFVTKDIQQDLKMLSLRMANECNLVER